MDSIFVTLLVFTPLLIIIGNISPPVGPLKVHWIFFGTLFMLSLLVMIKSRPNIEFLFILTLILIIQLIVSVNFNIKEYIDYISGPIAFIILVNIIVNEGRNRNLLKLLWSLFLLLLSIPVIIAMLQYLKILPLEFLEAKYINVTKFEGGEIQRVNGFLFHGIELSIIIFFLFLNIAVMAKTIKKYFFFLLMIVMEYVIIIKSAILLAIAFFVYHALIIEKRFKPLKLLIVVIISVAAFPILFRLIPDLQLDRFQYDFENKLFDPQLFTGRGRIWNVYIKAISNFDIWQILFGSGFGSFPIIFKQNATSDLWHLARWTPHPHNQLLDYFINGGLVWIFLISFVFYTQYKKLKVIFVNNQSFKKYYWGIVLLPIFIVGLTHPIMNMFIYWSCLGFTMVGLYLKFGLNEDSPYS